ncbi:MAG: hypothetical protein P8J33_01490, partial [Pirellulaceae bacterium]|nr:hypothetical protein [Pirellulaceae bacterium]
MPFIIGTDEAGYGPNLGPLVIGATLWEVPDHGTCLYSELSDVICKSKEFSLAVCPEKIPIGDSKTLYQSRGSLAKLERAVLAMLGVTQVIPKNVPELIQCISAPNPPKLVEKSTYHWDNVHLPVAANRDDLNELCERLRETLRSRGIHFHRMVVSIIFPEEFNRGLHDCGNKANLLSSTTCQLAKYLIDQNVPVDQNVEILFDKHGGRARYAGCLQQEMTDSFIRVVDEARLASHYQWQEGDRHLEAWFMAKGERHMPIGLASMVAKYVRELCMGAWNSFWCGQLPGLQPTAGYPQDAR